jgi:hypothetical protein
MGEIIQQGRVLGDSARAVRVREPENQDKPHSAIHGAINILVDTQTEAKAILEAWPEIVEAIRLKTEEVLGRAQPATEAT